MKQLSIFVENETGSLSKVTGVLKDSGINIRAIASFDSPEFGILRMIVDKPGEAKNVLAEHHFIVKMTDVLGIELEDTPGGLDRVLKALAENNLNINYIYSFVLRGVKEPLMILNIDNMKEAEKLLKSQGITVVEELPVK